MDKQLTIYDYNDSAVAITIPDFENVIAASCEVISGDEILTIRYADGSTKVFDSCPNGRIHGYYDGEVEIPLDHLDEISDISNSYEMLEHYGDVNARIRVGIESIFDIADLARKGEI